MYLVSLPLFLMTEVSRLLQQWVYVSPTGDVLFGKDAVEQGYVDPKNCFKNFKLDLGLQKALTDTGNYFS